MRSDWSKSHVLLKYKTYEKRVFCLFFFARLDDALLEVLTASKPSGRSITAAKRKEKEKKKRRKKKQNPKDVGHFLVKKLKML